MNSINLLIKFGSEEHIKQLQTGKMYMKNLKYYIDKEINTGDNTVGDKYDGLFPINNSKRVTSKVTNGSIVLFHNDADHTPEALPTILKCLKDEGYQFVFISDLIYKDNYKMDHAGKQIQCEPAESATSSVNSNP